jgi:hypothetical protein
MVTLSYYILHRVMIPYVIYVSVFANVLSTIFDFNASVNFYMFAGGTTYAFMSGANYKAVFPVYEPDVSSYGKS